MFLDEFLKTLKQENLTANFSCQILGFDALSIQGNFLINFFSSVKIVFSFKKQKMFVYGNNLTLKNIDKNQIVVCGNIFCIANQEVKFD